VQDTSNQYSCIVMKDFVGACTVSTKVLRDDFFLGCITCNNCRINIWREILGCCLLLGCAEDGSCFLCEER